MLEFDKAKSLDINFEDADEDPKNPTYLLYCLKYKQNLSHSLNAMWNGIYNGCVYGDGEYVVVECLYKGIDSNNDSDMFNGDLVEFSYVETQFDRGGKDIIIKYIISNNHKPFSHLNDYRANTGGFTINNILIEYSKHLRGRENKLNELENLIK